MLLNMFARKLPALLGFLLYTNTSQAFAIQSLSNNSKLLQPRQCEWDAGAEEFVCDDNLPTVADFVARMHDTSQDGSVDAAHSAVFYTGLTKPGEEFGETQASWFLGWLESAQVTHYWLYTAIDAHNSKCMTRVCVHLGRD